MVWVVHARAAPGRLATRAQQRGPATLPPGGQDAVTGPIVVMLVRRPETRAARAQAVPQDTQVRVTAPTRATRARLVEPAAPIRRAQPPERPVGRPACLTGACLSGACLSGAGPIGACPSVAVPSVLELRADEARPARVVPGAAPRRTRGWSPRLAVRYVTARRPSRAPPARRTVRLGRVRRRRRARSPSGPNVAVPPRPPQHGPRVTVRTGTRGRPVSSAIVRAGTRRPGSWTGPPGTTRRRRSAAAPRGPAPRRVR